MVSNISAIRKKYEQKVFDLMTDFDHTGFNTETYRMAFSKMSDRQFINMAKDMIKKDDFNFSIDTNSMDEKDPLTLDRINDISKKYNIPLAEYVIMPFRNPNGQPMVTLTPVPIIYVQIKRFFQQMLMHKNAISNTNEKINPITGQVTADNKTARTTDVQTYALTITNQRNSLKEFLGPRSDDEVSKQEMLTSIQQNGFVRLSDLNIKTHNKQSINTVETFMKAACLDVKFEGNDTASDIDLNE
jgi:hypothetical protein